MGRNTCTPSSSRKIDYMGTCGRALVASATFACLAMSLSCVPEPTLKVTTTADGGAGSLRAAIDAANALSGSGPAVRIEIPSGTYALDKCGSDDDNLAGDLDLTTARQVNLVATGAGIVIRQTCPGERVLDAYGDGLVSLVGVTVTGGTLDTDGPAESAQGGGVRTHADLVLDHATVTGNSAKGAPGIGADAAGTPTSGGGAQGGGVYVGGALVSTESTISSNTAAGGTGADAPASGAQSAAGGNAEGGGAYVVGAIWMKRGAVSENRALAGDGGTGDQRPTPGGAARGGGVAQAPASTGKVTVLETPFSNNLAQGGKSGAGGVSSWSVYTPTPSPILGQADATGGALAASGVLEVQQATLTSNKALGGASADCFGCAGSVGRGGAIAATATASVTGSALSLNQASGGARTQCVPTTIPDPNYPGYDVCLQYVMMYGHMPGACYSGGSVQATVCSPQSPVPALGGALWAGGELSVSAGSYSKNTADAGATVVSDTKVSLAGGDYSQNTGAAITSGGDVTIRTARISGNTGGGIQGTAVDAENVIVSDNGGVGIFASPPTNTSAPIKLKNSTITGNVGALRGHPIQTENVTIVETRDTAINADLYQEIVMLTNTTVTSVGTAVFAYGLGLEHSTLVGVPSQSGFPMLMLAALRTHASVVVGQGLPVCREDVRIIESSYNRFSDASCALAGTGDQLGTANFALGPVADNGGPVPTMLPGPGSVLIDAIPAAECTIATDARGITRPQGTGCDIGAVELEP